MFPRPLVAWDGLHYFIVALPEPSISNIELFDPTNLVKKPTCFMKDCTPLICAFVFAYAKGRFSHNAAHMGICL